MKFDFFAKISRFLKKDFNTTLSIGYLALVIVGMLFEVCLYVAFNINIVQYSDVSDFLLAPFRDPTILFFVAATILFIYFLTTSDEWFKQHFPRFHKAMYMGMDENKFKDWYDGKGAAQLIIAYVFFTAIIHGEIQEKRIKKATYSNTEVTFKDNVFAPTDTLIYIGKTNGYVFLYHRNTKHTEIVPIGDVLRLTKGK